MSQQINLFDPVFLTQKKYFSLFAMLQALGLIAAGSALFYGYEVYEVRQLAKQADETDKRYVAEQARMTNYAAQFSPQQSAQSLADELKQAQARADEQKSLIDTLKSGAVGNTTGYSEYMRAFARQAVSGLWLTGFDIVGDATRMSMSGGVLNPDLVPAYIERLGREPVMKGRSFAALQMQQPNKTGAGEAARYVEFTLRSVEADDGETKK